MALDPYSSCPCGYGKKIKFCCPDLINDLDKIQAQVSGNQLLNALETVKALESKYPNRACLLSYMALLGWATRQHQLVDETTKRFIEHHPRNPIALAFQAMKLVRDGNLSGGQNALQDALELCENELFESVYNAIVLMGQSMLGQGQILPARGLLTLGMVVSKGQDQNVMQALMQLEGSPTIPALLKDVPGYMECDKSAPYRNEFEGALRLAGRGCWRKAAGIWKEITKKNPEDPSAHRNLAVALGYLGDYRASADEWRAYAELDIPADEEVEAEATAQLLRRDESEGQVDDLLVKLEINDYDKVEQALLATRRAERLTIDMAQYADQGQPPPRAVFALFNRERPESSEGLKSEDVPLIIAHVYLFGKETDRNARAELDVYRTQYELVKNILKEICGDGIGGEISEEVTGQVSNLELALSWQWRLPENTDWKNRMRLLREQRENVLLNIWPTLKLPLLDGMTPAEASVDWNMRDRLQAAIMLLEMSDASQAAPVMFAKLREKLGLPLPEMLEPAELDYKRARLPRFLYVPVEKLDDKQLRDSYERVMVAQFLPAARKYALEVLKRPSLAGDHDLVMSAYQVMVRVTEDADESLIYIDAARKLADQIKESTAGWDLEELALRIARREGDHVGKLIQHISQAHMREEGIAEALYRLLANAGLVGPNGEMRLPNAAPGTSSAIVGAETTTAGAENKLWTPDGGEARGGEKKSSLWIPE